MAQITTAIADTVKKSEADILDLKNTHLSGEKLKQKLKMTTTIIDSRQLDMPRTVCANDECCSLTSHNNNLGAGVYLFKSICKFTTHTLYSISGFDSDIKQATTRAT